MPKKKKKKGKKKDQLARDMLAESMRQNMPPELIEQVLAELEAGRSMEDIMRALTDSAMGGDPTRPDQVVMRAATGTPESMRKLIEEHGVDPTIPNREGQTALMCAAEHANVPMMRFLVDWLLSRGGAAAASIGAQRRVGDGVRESQRATDGFTALHSACFSISTTKTHHLQATPRRRTRSRRRTRRRC